MPTDNKISLVKNKDSYIYLGLIRIAIWRNADSNRWEKVFCVFTKYMYSCMYSFELPKTLVITTFVSQELELVLAKGNLCFNKRWVVVSAVEQFGE